MVAGVDEEGVVPDVDGLEVTAAAVGAAGDCACFAADGGGGGGLDGGAAGAFAAETAAVEFDDVALLAIANTVDAIDGFPSPPSNDSGLPKLSWVPLIGLIIVNGGGTCDGFIGPNRFAAELRDRLDGRDKDAVGGLGLILLTLFGVNCAILFKTSAASIF